MKITNIDMIENTTQQALKDEYERQKENS